MSPRRRPHHARRGHTRQRRRAGLCLLALGLAGGCRETRPLADAAEESSHAGRVSADGSARGGTAGKGPRNASDEPSEDAGSANRDGDGDGGDRSAEPRRDGDDGDGGGDAAASGRGDESSNVSGRAGGTPRNPGAARPAFAVVSCGALSGASDCSVSGTGPELVVQGDVLTPSIVYEGGAVRLDANGVISCVGCDCGSQSARVVSCPDAVISPGFVNPHDHVAYAADAPRPGGVERYEHRHDWRLGLRGHEAIPYEGGASAVVRAAHELRMLLGGATSVAGGAGHQGLVRNPDMPALSEGLPTAPADSETFPLDDSKGLLLASGCAYGSSHARADDVARAGAYLAHLGEGIDREAHNELDCARAADFGLIGSSTAVVHATAVDAEQAAELGARKAVVVWSPRSNLALYGNTAPVPLLLRSGVEVALGTDWLLSGSMNLLRELDCARSVAGTYFDQGPVDHTLWSMVTLSAARAVGAGRALGRLAPGFLGDLSVIRRGQRAPFAAAVSPGAADFQLILRGGTPLYGRREVVSALVPTGCEDLDVCGAPKSVCASETGFTLAELEAAAEASYPLFACDTPPNEPSCVPARPAEYDGVPSDSDHDGDGIANADDLCPRVFDPIRPMDGGVQADADGDGLGDACDPCPLEPALDCDDQRTGDRDADGVADGADDCPDAPDAAQLDQDADGWGDACDFCPTPNPGIFPCQLAIASIRDPALATRPPRHALLELDALVVTALRPDAGNARGFYVTEGSAPFSGLFVYTASTQPGVEFGDQVSLRGRWDEYYGSDQLVLGALLARTSGEAPEPLDVDAAAIGDHGALAAAYDSMLVRVTGASVTRANPDAPSDYDETELTGALRLDDLLLPELDNAFAAGTLFSAVRGIAGTSFDHRKLWPRTAGDIEP